MTENPLDHAETIRAFDRSGMIDYCLNAAKWYQEAASLAQKITVSYPKPANIIVAGMGGSAIGGELFKDWAKTQLKVPIEVNREYHLPAYANSETLVLVSSYSGDTEETLSAYFEALQRKCMIYCVSSGGALIKYAKKHGVPFLQVPSGIPPRAALPFMFVPLLVYMEKAGLVEGVMGQLEETISLLEKISKENEVEMLTRDNFAKTVAQHIGETAPIIYGQGIYRSVAQRFKQQFNENSKSAAKWEVFPEVDHNEIVGWEGRGEQCRYFSVILIRDNDEPVEIQSRIDISQQIMERAGLLMFELKVQGKSPLAKMLSTVVLGDFISVYLAVMRSVDPTPVQTISYLKSSLSETGVREKIIAGLEKL
ncbi:MAG: bifunctional phosphoglucose/phosphomannose isomerase [Candidatus Bathyarchaeota archaeon]|nr:bifunctional phosphoglucose/phosphomannose isomerase [Candidatus Bathyarchaeota archaeon]